MQNSLNFVPWSWSGKEAAKIKLDCRVICPISSGHFLIANFRNYFTGDLELPSDKGKKPAYNTICVICYWKNLETLQGQAIWADSITTISLSYMAVFQIWIIIVLPYLFDSKVQYSLRQGRRHTFNGYCDHCNWRKLNLQCWSSLRCCNQSVYVYQNCLEQSQKYVCNGAHDHYNYMETRF